MNAFELMSTAFSSLMVNKLRSFLTMIGIVIGVASILSIISIGSGGQSAIVSTLESPRMQRTIQIVPTELMAPGIPQPGQVLSFDDADFALARQFSGVADVYSTLYGQADVQAQSGKATASVEAGPDFLADIGHFSVVKGRMFSSLEVLAHRNVALVSSSLAKQLFGNQDPIGESVFVNGQMLQIIGVATSSQGDLLSGFLGSQYFYLPSTTCTDLFPWWTVSEMDIQVQPGISKSDLSRRIVTALNIHAHNPTAFEDSSGTLVGLEKTIQTITSILTMVIGAIAGISLIVGGIGVMNIMLVAVSERTQEIGIRISLGATRRDVLTQFLMEAAVLTLVGGSVGVILGMSISEGIRVFAHFGTFVPWWAVIGSVLFSILVGVACGLYPANKAARMNPIDALRYE